MSTPDPTRKRVEAVAAFGSEWFRATIRDILIDRASLDEQIEEFFDEVLDDIEAAHAAATDERWCRPCLIRKALGSA